MKTIFTIEKKQVEVDFKATQEFYNSQNEIPKCCDCDDCGYFYKKFIHIPSKTLELIKTLGVDLGKNLRSEPTGVWCVRENNEKVVHIFQVYQVKGNLIDEKEFEYSNIENGLIMNVRFIQSTFDKIDIELTVNVLK